MEAAYTSAPPQDPVRYSDNERRCLVTGAVLPKADLIRFVVGPDDSIVPDLAQNLPGRGLWVTADYVHIHDAAVKNLFGKAAKAPVRATAALADQVVQLLRRRCLDFLGLARRSSIAILGQPQVESAIRAKNVKLLLIASDASDKGLQEVLHMHQLGDIPVVRLFSRSDLGAALGYDQIVYLGLMHHKLTSALQAELARFDKITQTQHVSERNG